MDLVQPVVLVVKAPNQQIADQTVECAWDWTIRKLKDHLARVYPSQPRQEQQKLIYYGRLLLDHLTLKDVLKQYEGQSTHTLHLVCSGSSIHRPEPATTTTTNSDESTTSTDGLRRRNTTSDVTEQTTPPQPQTNQIPSQAQYEAYYQQQMAQMATLNPHLATMNPQMMAYQQMYAHQMAQYMQYWQSMYQPPPAAPSPAPQPLPPAAPPREAAPAPAPGGNVVMNAGAGGAMFDEDEDQEQDWLDWFYTGCRFAVLIMIIYFYSTIPRAVVGLMFFFFLYMYQQGWFNLQPRRPDVIAAPAPPAPAEEVPPPEAPQQEPPQEPQQNQNQESTESSDTPPASEVETPPAVSRLYVTWTFFKTFFTSLLPRPQAVV